MKQVQEVAGGWSGTESGKVNRYKGNGYRYKAQAQQIRKKQVKHRGTVRFLEELTTLLSSSTR